MEDGRIDPRDLIGAEQISLELHRPISVDQSRKNANVYTEFIGSLRTKVTIGCVQLIRGLRSVIPNPSQPYFLVPLTVHDGRKFETCVVIDSKDLYVVVFKSGQKFYEMIEEKQLFNCERAPSQIKKSYSSKARERDISPKAFLNALLYLAKDQMNGAQDDYEGIQLALDTIYWYISEPARFARILRKHRSYLCDYENWDTFREKTEADHEVIGCWSSLSYEVRVAVAAKTNELNISDTTRKLIEVPDLNNAAHVTLGLLSKAEQKSDGKRRRTN